jgi:transposase
LIFSFFVLSLVLVLFSRFAFFPLPWRFSMIRFSDEDQEALEQAFKETKHRKVHIVYLRATCLPGHRQAGRSRKAVAALFLVTPATVTNYCKLYKQQGIAGLLANNYKGRRALLSSEQEAELLAYLDTHYVQGKALQAYLWEQFQLKYSVWGALRLAHRMGYVSKKRNGVQAKRMPKPNAPLSRSTARFVLSFRPIKRSASSTSPALSTTAVQHGV